MLFNAILNIDGLNLLDHFLICRRLGLTLEGGGAMFDGLRLARKLVPGELLKLLPNTLVLALFWLKALNTLVGGLLDEFALLANGLLLANVLLLAKVLLAKLLPLLNGLFPPVFGLLLNMLALLMLGRMLF